MKILDVRIDSMPQGELEKQLTDFINGKKFNHLATVNPEFLVESVENPRFKKILNKTTLNICDGFGISFWTKILYKKKIVRIPGVQLAELICQLAEREGKSVYLLGGFGVTTTAKRYLVSQYPNITVVGHEDGHPDRVSQKLIDSKPDIILVAFGAPKQEYWLDQFGPTVPSLRLGIGIGGTFDFWAGKVTRAPKWMQKFGLEWCWRLLQEPIKRARRIYTAVVVFSILAIKEKLQRL